MSLFHGCPLRGVPLFLVAVSSADTDIYNSFSCCCFQITMSLQNKRGRRRLPSIPNRKSETYNPNRQQNEERAGSNSLLERLEKLPVEVLAKLRAVENDKTLMPGQNFEDIRDTDLIRRGKKSTVTTKSGKRLEISLVEGSFRRIAGLREQVDISGSCAFRTVEIHREPGRSLGFYIRQGDGWLREDGVFVSRVNLGSMVETNGLLSVGDEILKVNDIDVAKMPLDDVVAIMQCVKKLVLTIKVLTSVSLSRTWSRRSRRLPSQGAFAPSKASSPKPDDGRNEVGNELPKLSSNRDSLLQAFSPISTSPSQHSEMEIVMDIPHIQLDVSSPPLPDETEELIQPYAVVDLNRSHPASSTQPTAVPDAQISQGSPYEEVSFDDSPPPNPPANPPPPLDTLATDAGDRYGYEHVDYDKGPQAKFAASPTAHANPEDDDGYATVNYNRSPILAAKSETRVPSETGAKSPVTLGVYTLLKSPDFSSPEEPDVSQLSNLTAVDESQQHSPDRGYSGMLIATVHRVDKVEIPTGHEISISLSVDSSERVCTQAYAKFDSTEIQFGETYHIDLLRNTELTLSLVTSAQSSTNVLPLSQLFVDQSDQKVRNILLDIKHIGELKLCLEYRPMSLSIPRMDSMSDHSLSAATLSDLARSNPSTSGLPLAVERCVHVIEQHGLETPGLYQLCAPEEDKERAFDASISQTKSPEDMRVIVSQISVHAFTGILKDFFRNLPKSFFTDSICLGLTAATSAKDTGDSMLQNFVECLPEEVLTTLNFLLAHFREVCKHSVTNEMTSDRLAEMFGPLLLTPAADEAHPDQYTQDYDAQANVIRLLMSQHKY